MTDKTDTSQTQSGRKGCFILAGVLLLVGVALGSIGVLSGGTTAHNVPTGRSEGIDSTLYILAGVFGGLGLLGLVVLLLPTKDS